jgi:hypothetical protein
VAVQIFNDDGGFRHVAPPGVIAQHREFAQRPDRFQLGAIRLLAEVDDALVKVDAVSYSAINTL